jgi:hypothetical protein
MNPFAGSLAPVSGMWGRQTAGSASAPGLNSTGPCSFLSLKVLSIIILFFAGYPRRTIRPRPSVPARACYPPQDQPAWSVCNFLVSNCLNPSQAFFKYVRASPVPVLLPFSSPYFLHPVLLSSSNDSMFQCSSAPMFLNTFTHFHIFILSH